MFNPVKECGVVESIENISRAVRIVILPESIVSRMLFDTII